MVAESHTIYCIIGRTGSGKDTVAKGLQEMGMKSVCSYATRPIRDNETEGIEHYFISQKEMSDILKTKQIAAYTKIGNVEYCATVEEVMKSDIYVIDPKGLEDLRKAMSKELMNKKIDICALYIYTKPEIRNERILNSGRGQDAIDAFIWRNEAENEQFNDYEENCSYDYILENNSTSEDLIELVNKIIQENEERKKNINYIINRGVGVLESINEKLARAGISLEDTTPQEHDDYDR